MNADAFKQIVKRWIPPVVVEARRAWRRRSDLKNAAHEKIVEDLRRGHESRQATKLLTEYVLRDGIQFNISPLAIPGFDHFCYLDPEMVHEMDVFLKLAQDHRRFLDIGALHGVFSLAFTSLSPDRKALAYDPSPMAFPILQYHQTANARLDIAVAQKALSDVATTLVMDYHWQHMRALGAGDPVSSETLSFQTAVGDEECESHQFAPDLVKIDVEGAELMVLRGLQKIIQLHHPTIMVEVHPELLPRHGTTTRDVLEYLSNQGYGLETLAGASVNPSTFVPAFPADRVVASARA